MIPPSESITESYCLIPVGRGLFTKVSPQDYVELCRYNWRVRSVKNAYVQGRLKNGGQESIYMSRLLLGAVSGQFVDHIDRDKLNNQRSNLRFCTRSENQWNRTSVPNSASRYKGVEAKRKRWAARIAVNGKVHRLGVYTTQEEAALAYNEDAKRLHGSFAVLNEVRLEA